MMFSENNTLENIVIKADIRPQSDLIEVRDALEYLSNHYDVDVATSLRNVRAELENKLDRLMAEWDDNAPPYTCLETQHYTYTVDWDQVHEDEVPVIRDYAFQSDYKNWPTDHEPSTYIHVNDHGNVVVVVDGEVVHMEI